jgi:hypothetical protein
MRHRAAGNESVAPHAGMMNLMSIVCARPQFIKLAVFMNFPACGTEHNP